MSGESSEGSGELDPTGAVPAAKIGAAAVEESRGLLRRVLGQPADAIGTFLSQWVEIKTRNALRVAERADARLASQPGSDDGQVSLRSAMRIFDESAYCDDEIVTEYLGGILAAARLAGPTNDLANSYAALISRLSGMHLRVHYILYKSIHYAYNGQDHNVFDSEELTKLRCFIPFHVIEDMFDDDEGGEIGDLYTAMFWLDRESLITEYEGGPRTLARYQEQLTNPTPGMIVSPSLVGLDLFLWGLGYPGNVHLFFGRRPEDYEIRDFDVSTFGVQGVNRE